MKIRNVVKIIGHCVAAKDYEVAEAFLQSYIDTSTTPEGEDVEETCDNCLHECMAINTEPCKSCATYIELPNWRPKI